MGNRVIVTTISQFTRSNRLKAVSHSFLLLLLFQLITFSSSYAQEKAINGVVTSKEEGTPLSGVSIVVKGTKTGTQSDAQGKFSLHTSADKSTLIFTSVGFGTHEMEADYKTPMQVILTSDSKHLNEVVVSGYATQSRKDFTGAAARVSSAQLENKPVQSFEQALAGQAAGVSIIQPSG